MPNEQHARSSETTVPPTSGHGAGRPYLQVVPAASDDSATASDRAMIEATNAALALFGAKWKVDVLYLLASGVRRRHKLHDHLLVSKRVLTEVLRGLERDGLVRRQVHDRAPIRVDYTLTPLGRSLTAPLFTLYEWADAHMETVHKARDNHDARWLSDATRSGDAWEQFGAASQKSCPASGSRPSRPD